MSAKKGLSIKAFYVPDNPTWIEFERSDGDSSTWPTKTQRIVDDEGQVNFHRPLDVEESHCVRWRVETALALANQMNMPAGPNYVLKDWPAGYKLFDHHKGPAAEPRHDLYLFGPKGMRFRSVNEFIPHAYWLLNPKTSCLCKYCSKRPQREITFSLGLSQKPPSSSPTPGRIKPRLSGATAPDRGHPDRRARQPGKPYAALQKVFGPVKDRVAWPKGPKYSMSRDRNSDLRAIHSSNGMLLKRWFREGELLWCALDAPIPGPTSGVDIAFWPGLVEEIIIKPEAIPRNGEDVDMQDTPAETGDSRPSGSRPANNDASCPWVVRQSIVYKMKFLSVRHSAFFADHRVLPYQAWVISPELRHAMENFRMDVIDLSPEVLRAFDPSVSPKHGTEHTAETRRFEDAVGPYALAIQAAAHISNFWSPTDDWEFRYAAPLAAPSEPSLAQAITMATSSIAAVHEEMDETNGGKSQQGDVAARVLGQPPTPHPFSQMYSQLRYQGLWWGAERIWIDELVRLKVARKQLAPRGGSDIYPPAGPSQSTIDYRHKVAALYGQDHSEPECGAEARGVFMRVEGLFVVDVPKTGGVGTMKECRVSGMLYELADADWVDPFDAETTDGAPAPSLDVNNKEPPAASGSSSLPPTRVQNIDPALLSDTADVPKGESSQDVPSALPASPQGRTTSGQLSHPPLDGATQLPVPPKGYRFRPILAPGCEAVMSLTMISGRYYPQLLAHPLLQPFVERAIGDSFEGGLQHAQHLWALEGLAPGYYNAVDPIKAKADRMSMVKDAERQAREELVVWTNSLVAERAKKEAEERAEEQAAALRAVGGMIGMSLEGVVEANKGSDMDMDSDVFL